jgi:hypothetical protein
VPPNTHKNIPDAKRAAEIAAEQQAADLIGVPMAVAVPAHARFAGRLSLWKDPRPLPTLLIDAEDWARAYMRGTKAHPSLCPAVLRWAQCRIWREKYIVGSVIDPELRTRLEAAGRRRQTVAQVAFSANIVVTKLAKMAKAGTFPADLATAVHAAKAVWIEECISRLDAPQSGKV